MIPVPSWQLRSILIVLHISLVLLLASNTAYTNQSTYRFILFIATFSFILTAYNEYHHRNFIFLFISLVFALVYNPALPVFYRTDHRYIYNYDMISQLTAFMSLVIIITESIRGVKSIRARRSQSNAN